MHKKYCIVYCYDEKQQQNEFGQHSVGTLFQTTDLTDIDVCIITSKCNKCKYRKEVNVVCLEDIQAQLPEYHSTIKTVKQRWGYFTFLRLALSYVDIFKKYEKLLVLDNDTEVLQDISGIFDIDMKGKWFSCTLERHWKAKWLLDEYDRRRQYLMHLVQHIPERRQSLQEMIDFRNYCAGILLVDNAQILKDIKSYSLRLEAGVKAYVKHKFPIVDQDIFNIFFDDKMTPMDCKYHRSYYTVNDLHDVFGMKKCKILHYAAPIGKKELIQKLSKKV